jgi:hypothetical protein
MEERDHLEAQYWWAFSCLVLAGRRGPAEFHAELMRRTACSFPTPEEVEAVVDEAVSCLGDVLNAGLYSEVPRKLSMTGWKRHLLALTMRPDPATSDRGAK